MPEADLNEKPDTRAFTFFRGSDDLRTLREQLKDRGLFGTLRFLIERSVSRLGWQCYYLYHRGSERRFDRKHVVRTRGVVYNDNLTLAGSNRESGLEYEPTPVRALPKMLSVIGSDFSDFTFIDFGSGMGRMLLLASLHNFKSVRGVEYARELHEIAAENIHHFQPAARQCVDVQSVWSDAAEFEIPAGNCVFYLYFPFHETVFRTVMRNIVASYRQSPRKMYFIVRLDKPDWTEVTLRVFSEYPEIKLFAERRSRSTLRFVPFDVVYYSI